MFIDKTPEELTTIFVNNLLITNRGFNYYVDWKNMEGYSQYLVEIHALDVLVRCKDDDLFKARFADLVDKLPKTILLFPFLFGLAKEERKKLNKGKSKLTIIQDEIDGADNLTYAFPSSVTSLTTEQIEIYYNF